MLRALALLALGCAATKHVSPPAEPLTSEVVSELFVLFDQARLGRDDVALGQLWQQLGLDGTPERGLAATRQVIEALVGRAQGDAAVLVALDRAMLEVEPSLGHHTRELRRIVRESGPLAASAALRLHAICTESLREAAATPGTSLKIELVNRCLYAVQDADPAPYFSPNPAARPPDPSWKLLAARAAEQLRRAVLSSHALHAVAEQRLAAEREFLERAAPSLPSTLEVASSGLPRLQGGVPYDRFPIIEVAIEGIRVDGVDLGFGNDKALRAVLSEDRRRRVTIVAPAAMTWWRVLEALKTARRAGAVVADLAVIDVLDAKVPAGDVHAGQEELLRLAGFPVALYTMVPGGKTPSLPREFPRGFLYDTDSATGERLLIRAETSKLVLAGGKSPKNTYERLGELEAKSLRVSAEPNVLYARVLEEIARAFVQVPALGLEIYRE